MDCHLRYPKISELSACL